MIDSDNSPVSRRNWLGLITTASLGTGLLAATTKALGSPLKKGLDLQNIRFKKSSDDFRPAIVFDNVQDVAVNGLSIEGQKESESLVRFIESKDVLLSEYVCYQKLLCFYRYRGPTVKI